MVSVVRSPLPPTVSTPRSRNFTSEWLEGTGVSGLGSFCFTLQISQLVKLYLR